MKKKRMQMHICSVCILCTRFQMQLYTIESMSDGFDLCSQFPIYILFTIWKFPFHFSILPDIPKDWTETDFEASSSVRAM